MAHFFSIVGCKKDLQEQVDLGLHWLISMQSVQTFRANMFKCLNFFLSLLLMELSSKELINLSQIHVYCLCLNAVYSQIGATIIGPHLKKT